MVWITSRGGRRDILEVSLDERSGVIGHLAEDDLEWNAPLPQDSEQLPSLR
jgi:hypothetical protein